MASVAISLEARAEQPRAHLVIAPAAEAAERAALRQAEELPAIMPAIRLVCVWVGAQVPRAHWALAETAPRPFTTEPAAAAVVVAGIMAAAQAAAVQTPRPVAVAVVDLPILVVSLADPFPTDSNQEMDK